MKKGPTSDDNFTEHQRMRSRLASCREELEVMEREFSELHLRNTSLQEADQSQIFLNQFVRYLDLVHLLEKDLEALERRLGLQDPTGRQLSPVIIKGEQTAFWARFHAFHEGFLLMKAALKDFEKEWK